MPTTRSANKPPPKRALSPDSDDEDDEFTIKRSASSRGRRGENKQGGSAKGRGSRGGAKATATGKPPAKRGRKKKAAKSDSEDERTNFDSDHLHEDLKKCHSLLIEFAKEKHEGYTFPFKRPVDTAALGLVDYHEIVKKPMDLMTMKKKLIGEEYDTAVEFKEDFKLIISNCLLYNNRRDPVSQLALQFRDAFANKWKDSFPEDEDDFGKKNDEDEDDEEEDEEEGEEEESDKGTETKGQEENDEGESSEQGEKSKSVVVSRESDNSGQSAGSTNNSQSSASDTTGNENRNEADSTINAVPADSTTEESIA